MPVGSRSGDCWLLGGLVAIGGSYGSKFRLGSKLGFIYLGSRTIALGSRTIGFRVANHRL